MNIISEQLIILGILVLIGIIAARAKVLTEHISSSLTKVILKITLPLLIFTTFADKTLNTTFIYNGIVVFISAIFSVFLLYILGSFVARISKLNKQRKKLHQVQTMFGNIVFLGFPLLDSLFPGGEGLMYASIFQIAHDSLVWTLGVFMLGKESKEESKHKKKILLNPNTIAFILGISFMLTPFSLPELIILPMAKLGHTTIYLSMLYIGYILQIANIKEIFKDYRAYILSLNKLIIAPLIILFLLSYLQQSGIISISNTALQVIIFQVGMPGMIVISILAKEMGYDEHRAITNIFVSTILSLGSLQFLFYLMNTYFIV